MSHILFSLVSFAPSYVWGELTAFHLPWAWDCFSLFSEESLHIPEQKPLWPWFWQKYDTDHTPSVSSQHLLKTVNSGGWIRVHAVCITFLNRHQQIMTLLWEIETIGFFCPKMALAGEGTVKPELPLTSGNKTVGFVLSDPRQDFSMWNTALPSYRMLIGAT